MNSLVESRRYDIMDDYVFIGQIIKERRLKLDLTIEEVSFQSNISEKTISKLERGVCTCRFETLLIITKTLGINTLQSWYKYSIQYKTKVFDIIEGFTKDLKLRNYSNLNVYITSLDELSKIVNGNRDLINLIEKCMRWIKCVKQSVEGRNYKNIEEEYYEMLGIDNNVLISEGIRNKELSRIDMYILNSVVANRARNNVMNDSLCMLEHMLEHIEEMEDSAELHLITLVNICNQLLELQSYDKVQNYAKEGIDLTQETGMMEYKVEFDYLLKLIGCLNNDVNKDQLSFVLKIFKYQEVGRVVPNIVRNLEEKYDIVLE